jgi:ergothioneine biosynthesis protein EgtB
MGNATSAVYSAPAADAALALRHGPPEAVRAALLAARERTLSLAQDFVAALGPQLSVPRADELNPPLWELGHIAWFQEWWIARNPQRGLGVAAPPAAARTPSVLADADTWYDSSRVAHDTRWQLPLPDREATESYLACTLARTLELLDDLPEAAGDEALYFFRLTAMHEQMHAEAAVYMANTLGIPVRDAGQMPRAGPAAQIEVRGQRFELGAAPGGFAFDNELPARTVELAPFVIDAEPVTWGAFLPFVEAGGYVQPQWWTAEGQAWLRQQPPPLPAGLRRGSGGWEQLRHGRWLPLAGHEVAVHLSAHEADAWCRWAGRRLPSEAEWECAALTRPGFRWGHAWEWTASRFEPYPGFAPHPYREYSQPWFGTHRVLRGASGATAPALAHARYRNFFVPQRRDILAGWRSARSL